uniref:Uncharacterized protein n=1 Tax=Rhizophora mucronata TaxID=61149 RepID=A0A2P2PB11_RHIMU
MHIFTSLEGVRNLLFLSSMVHHCIIVSILDQKKKNQSCSLEHVPWPILKSEKY